MKLLPLSNDLKGQNYDKLPRIYSINISTFTLFPKQSQFHLVFQIKERKNPEILLTEDFEIHILELPKLKKNIFFIIFNHFMQFLTIKRT